MLDLFLTQGAKMLTFCLLATAVAWEPLAPRTSPRRVVLHNHHAERIAYPRALSWQRALHAERAAQLRPPKGAPPEPQLDDAAILLQHPPTYTLGTSSDVGNVLGGSPAFELVRTERGGEVRRRNGSSRLHHSASPTPIRALVCAGDVPRAGPARLLPTPQPPPLQAGV